MCFWGLEDQANSGEGEWELFCHPSPIGGEGPLWVGGAGGDAPARRAWWKCWAAERACASVYVNVRVKCGGADRGGVYARQKYE